MTQQKGIHLRVNIAVICVRGVFDFYWQPLAVIKETVGDPQHNTLDLLDLTQRQRQTHS